MTFRGVVVGVTVATCFADVARAEDAPPPADPLSGEVWRTQTAVMPDQGARTIRVEAAVRPGLAMGTRDIYKGTGRVAFAIAIASWADLRVAGTGLPIFPVLGPVDLELAARFGVKRSGRVRLAVLAGVHVGGVYLDSSDNKSRNAVEAGAAFTLCEATNCAGAVSVAGTLSSVSSSFQYEGNTGRSDLYVATATANVFQPVGRMFALFAAALAAHPFGHSSPDPTGLVELRAAAVGVRLLSRNDGGSGFRQAFDLMACAVNGSYRNESTTPPVYLIGFMWSATWGAHRQPPGLVEAPAAVPAAQRRNAKGYP